MASELAQAIQQVCEDKKISLESVISTIESALGAAYRKDFGHKLQNIKVEFDMETGGFKVYDTKEVVEDELKEEYERIKEEKMKLAELEEQGGNEEEIEKLRKKEIEEKEAQQKSASTKGEVDPDKTTGVSDGAGEEEVKKFNPKMMISLSEAKEIKKKSKLGEELIQELPVEGDFGRMAAQTAKQVIIQKLREAERSTILDEYQDKVGELLTGTVQRVEGAVVLVDFGNVTAVMPLEEGIRSERYSPGARFKFYIKNVEESARGPKVIVSRTHPDIIRKLFKLEVPEIASGTVQIKSIAREAGSRTKIAVFSKEDNIDPIGSAVGQRGTRVQTIINEIGGEKIDIIEWEEDPIKFIAKALSPAKIIRVEVKGQEGKDKKKESSSDQKEELDKKEEQSGVKEAIVYVLADQLSLAIGKEGQNVRLAAKLTGWKIDIMEDKLVEDAEKSDDEEKGETGSDKKEEAVEEKPEKEKEEKEEEAKELAPTKERNQQVQEKPKKVKKEAKEEKKEKSAQGGSASGGKEKKAEGEDKEEAKEDPSQKASPGQKANTSDGVNASDPDETANTSHGASGARKKKKEVKEKTEKKSDKKEEDQKE